MNNITKNSLKKISLYLSVLGFFVSTFFFTALPHHAHADNTVNLIPGSLNLYAGNDVCNTKKIEAADAIRKTPGLTKDEKDARVAESDKTIEAECYQFLEPLPAVTPDGANAEATAIQITPTEGIGASFNNMYSIAIGIGSVVAVVMIVIYGFKYMTSESGGGNLQKLKSRITNVVLGLLLLVGIYVILNTINPNLLDVQPDVGKEFIDTEEWNFDEDVIVPGVNGGQGSITRAAADCKGGIINIPNIFNKKPNAKTICKDLSDKLILLKQKTEAQGVSFRITSTMDGNHQSSCHKVGRPKSGSCVDIGLIKPGAPGTDKEWGILCAEVSKIDGLDFLNEVMGNQVCHNIKRSVNTQYATGNHIHINLTK